VRESTITSCFKNAVFGFEPNEFPEMLYDDAEDDLAEMLQSISLGIVVF